MLVLIRLAGFLGTTLIGALIKKSVYWVLIASPVMMAAIALSLIMFGDDKGGKVGHPFFKGLREDL